MLNANLEKLKKAVEDFYNVTHMKIVLYDEMFHILYTYPEKMNPFCAEIRKCGELDQICKLCDQKGFAACKQTKQISIYRCHMGLTEAIAPICENGVIIGYMMLGQVLENSDKTGLIDHAIQTAQKYHLNGALLVSELKRMKVKSRKTVVSAASMMEMCACYLWLNQIVSVRHNALAELINSYISENMNGDLSVKGLCRRFNLSRSALYQLSTEYFSMGISDYVRLKRIEKAKELIQENDLSIGEIAVKVGIDDAAYFTKVFKQVQGCTPKAYQKQYVPVSR